MASDMSFSSDTGMAECLVIARKNAPVREKALRLYPGRNFTSLASGVLQGFAEAQRDHWPEELIADCVTIFGELMTGLTAVTSLSGRG